MTADHVTHPAPTLLDDFGALWFAGLEQDGEA